MNERCLVLAVALVWLTAAGVEAQQGPEPDARRLSATRPELEALMQRLAADRSVRAVAARTTAARRLVDGDLQPGDGVLLAVQGEPALSDTFVVGPARELALPMAGGVTIRGVLHSEIESYLTEQIGKFVVDPVVRARGLVRVSVTGAVGRPGFYLVGADALLSDAVMAAGGLTADAKLGNLRVERGGVHVLAGAPVRRALAEGRTLAEADIRSGDQFVVPGGRHGTTYEQLRLGTLLLSIPLTVYGLTRIF